MMVAATFARFYRQQLELEEKAAMPLLCMVIADDALRVIATEMTARRGLVEEATCPTEA